LKRYGLKNIRAMDKVQKQIPLKKGEIKEGKKQRSNERKKDKNR
jgi:hypothetical protein